MKIGHASSQKYSSTTSSFSISSFPRQTSILGTPTTPGVPTPSIKPVFLNPASGGAMTCARLAATQSYNMIKIQELKNQGVPIPAYLAGYKSAAEDSLAALGCSLNGRLNTVV